LGIGEQAQNPGEAAAFRPVPLAIVGMGCLFPKADSAEAFWANIKGGVDAVTEIPETHWDPAELYDQDPAAPDRTYGRRGAFLEPIDFNPLDFGIAPNNIEAIDTTQLLGMVVAQQALRSAGYATGKDAKDGRPFNRDKTSVILGVTGALEAVIPLGARLGHPIWRKALAEAGVEKTLADDVVQRISDSYVPWQENSFPGLLGNVAAGRIANRFDLGGTNCVVDAACASSLGALHMAAMELYAGRSEMAITGGVDTFNDIFMYMCFSKTPALSPTGSARPFSAGGDGTILGEGIGVIVLKRLADAQRDGDNIRAVIRSIGSSSDGKGNAVYAPSAAGQVKCLVSAYAEAGISPETIELVEGHGTGTKVGDAVEAKALDQVFRAAQPEGTWCALGSVKSMVGHTKAAAGIAGLIKAALALEHKVLPPTIKVEQPLEAVRAGKALYVNTEKRPWVGRKEHPRRAGVSAFGFGGSNFHCVLEEEGAVKRAVDWDDSVVVMAFGGASRDAIAKQMAGVDAAATWAEIRAEGARLRAGFSGEAACRLVMVVQKEEGAAKGLATAQRMLASQAHRESWSTPDGIYFGAKKAGGAGKMAALFPGQGSQYVGMMRDLACQFPEMLGALEAADAAFGESACGARLSDAIYPIPVFDAPARGKLEERLARTEIAQPAIGAVSAGAWRVLRHFGVGVDAAGGHSFGELVALAAAGRIDEGELHTLANARGRAMAAAAQSGAAGAMLAVSANAADVERIIAAERLKLVVANKNSPTQVVLSGGTGEIEKAERVLGARGVRCKRLSVSAAFHSALVAEAQRPFAASLSAVALRAGEMPVFANTTGREYPVEAKAAAALLAGQLAKPVEFVAEIEAMHAAGVRTFIEVGPGGKLSGLVKAILGDREHVVAAMDASAGKRSGIADLACVLAQLAASGHRVDLTRWDAEFAARSSVPAAKKPAMSMRLSGANYVKPRAAAASRPAIVAKLMSAPAPTAVTESPTKGRASLNSLNQNTPAAVSSFVSSTPAATALPQALQATQQSILMLQKMQEQTAQLHQQYLHGQEIAQQTIHQLIEQQMRLLSGASGVAMPVSAPIARPQIHAPVVQSPVVEIPVVSRPTANGTAHVNGSAPKPRPAVVAVPPALVAVAEKEDTLKRELLGAQTVLLEVVAEKTGYPVEMLELDMSLDTDLGIDSIKRVEILSALQTRMPEAPVVKPEDLGRLQTLRQIVAFLGAGEGDKLKVQKLKVEKGEIAPQSGKAQEVLLEVVAEKTGYPVEMLELDMSLDTDLGIDSIKRVEILSALQTRMPEAPVVKPEDLGRLQTLRQIVQFLDNSSAAATVPRVAASTKPVAPAIAEAPRQVVSAKKSDDELDRQVLTVVPINGETLRPSLTLAKGAKIWITDDGAGLSAAILSALKARHVDAEIVSLDAKLSAPLAGLLLVAPAHPAPAFIHDAFTLIQRTGPALRATGATADAFLISASSMDGCFALNGHTPKNPLTGGLAGLVKTAAHEWPEVACKSLDLSHDLHDLDAIAQQIADELFLKGPSEVGISPHGRCETRLVRKALNGEVGQHSIGAGDVIVVTGGARGVTAAVSLAVAKAYQCKLLLLGRSAVPTSEPEWLIALTDEGSIKKAIAKHTKGATPRMIEEQFRRVMGNREITTTLRQIEEAGATVVYRSLDVRDAKAVQSAIADARATLGPIVGIIHGAGVLQDRLIEQKTTEQFEEVFSTKVGGFNALLDAAKNDDLKVIVAFSSSTGRFGRKGQVAYAAANEVLNKLAQREAHQRPRCRVLSVNWGPWEGGMVTPQLRRIFENEGVGLIPLVAGAEYLVREMATPAGGPVEIVILGPTPGKGSNGSSAMTLAFERELSVESHAFLRSHVIKGKAVLPAAMMVEWLAHGAMHEHPGLAFQGFDDLRIFKGVTLGEKEPVALRVFAGGSVTRDGSAHVPMELRSGNVLHARATILLGDAVLKGRAATAVVADRELSGEVYGDGRLFHGAELQGIETVVGWSAEGIIGKANAAPAPSAWMRQPLRSSWISDPLALDVAFQLMILWCFETHGAGSLPTSAASYRQFVKAFPAGGTRVQARVLHAGEHSAEAAIEFLDSSGKVVAAMNGYECVMDESLKSAFATNQLA
jgi:acyl transferase domain-containing protein